MFEFEFKFKFKFCNIKAISKAIPDLSISDDSAVSTMDNSQLEKETKRNKNKYPNVCEAHEDYYLTPIYDFYFFGGLFWYSDYSS